MNKKINLKKKLFKKIPKIFTLHAKKLSEKKGEEIWKVKLYCKVLK